jgi:single-strand DNA-binding protein
MYNKVILIGRLGQDPEMRYTPSGAAVTNFTLATDSKWRDKQGNLQEETTWHDVVCWLKQAEFVAEYAKKGRLVFVEGEIQKRSWEDKNGNKRISVEIRAKIVRLLEWAPGGERPAQASKPAAEAHAAGSIEPELPPPTETEDDVPF